MQSIKDVDSYYLTVKITDLQLTKHLIVQTVKEKFMTFEYRKLLLNLQKILPNLAISKVSETLTGQIFTFGCPILKGRLYMLILFKSVQIYERKTTVL